jgi:hypothetical protein
MTAGVIAVEGTLNTGTGRHRQSPLWPFAGLRPREAFDQNDRPVGIYPNQKLAADALTAWEES